jgi:succinate-acetate transporter protein
LVLLRYLCTPYIFRYSLRISVILTYFGTPHVSLLVLAAGWAQDLTWISLAFFYGGLAQLLAGMWEFRRNNTFAATAFTTYGAFWMSLALFIVFVLVGLIPATFNVGDALGWFCAGFFIITFYLAVCSLLVDIAVIVVLWLLVITFLCLFIGNFSGNGNWVKAAGYFGIFTAAAAFYASFAKLFNAICKRHVVYVGKPLLNYGNTNANTY